MDKLTTTLSPLVIDIIFLVFILLVAALRAKAGLFQSVASVAIIIIALAIGLVGAKMLSPQISNYYWESYGPKVEEKFDKQVAQAQSGEGSIAETFAGAWNNILSGFDSKKADEFKINIKDTDYSDPEMVQKLKAVTMLKAKLMVEKVSHLAVLGVITAIALFVLTIIKNILDKVANFSIVGWANHLGGFILGAVEAIVILIVIVRVAGMMNIQIFQNISEGTVLLKWLIGGDVQAAISGIQNLSVEDLKNIKLEDLTTIDFNDVGSQVKDLLNTVKLPEGVDVNGLGLNGVGDQVKELVNSVEVPEIKVPDVNVNVNVKDLLK